MPPYTQPSPIKNFSAGEQARLHAALRNRDLFLRQVPELSHPLRAELAADQTVLARARLLNCAFSLHR